MSALRIMVGGRDYDVACGEGEEQRLQMLARNLDGRVREIGQQVGRNAGEAQLLLLASLMLTDETQDLKREVTQLKSDIQNSSQSFETNKQIELENAIASTIHDIASRIETIAHELESL